MSDIVCHQCSIKSVNNAMSVTVKLGAGNCAACVAEDAKARPVTTPAGGREVTWPGTQLEGLEFSVIMVRLTDCACVPEGFNNMGVPHEGVWCQAHKDAMTDQKWLNKLVFMRRLVRMSMPNARYRVGQVKFP